jgi:hypothetical protein
MYVVHMEHVEPGVFCEVGQLLVHVRPRVIDCDDVCVMIRVNQICRQKQHALWYSPYFIPHEKH